LGIVDPADDVCAGPDERAQQEFLADDVQVVLEVRRRVANRLLVAACE
jgi:hypothetical protein